METVRKLELASFTPLVGSRCVLHAADGGKDELELMEAKPLGSTQDDPGVRTQAFSVLFRGGSGRIHPQATYPLEITPLGTVELFLVPIGQQRDGSVEYEAIFT